MQDTLRNQVIYGEQQIKFLQDEIGREHSLQLSILREKKENRKKFKQFHMATLFLLIVAIFIWILTQGFKMDDPTDWIRGISIILLGPLFIFAIIGLLVCIPKTIHYVRQLKGTEDSRRSGYTTYEEMWLESQSRMKYLDRELTQNILMLEVNKNLLEERRQLEVQNDQEFISMDEVYQLREEKD